MPTYCFTIPYLPGGVELHKKLESTVIINLICIPLMLKLGYKTSWAQTLDTGAYSALAYAIGKTSVNYIMHSVR